MDVHDDVRYSQDHEWARREDVVIRCGITDFAQDALGDVVFVDPPVVNAHYERDARVGEIESTKSVSEIYAPISGVVREVNSALTRQPELINRAPYGEGWMFVIEPDSAADFESLLSPDEYRRLTSE